MLNSRSKIKLAKEGGRCDLESICHRLHRINGQVLAIEKMLMEKRDFVQILQQTVAAREALDKVAVLILESEARGCLSSKQSSQANKQLNKIITSLFKTI
ncbi:metal-sensitive transcriptional regulator [Patescibacteria group bacterium]|nr:metal-sensitive transcriptional regulator [Patescibacteria group bacterium]